MAIIQLCYYFVDNFFNNMNPHPQKKANFALTSTRINLFIHYSHHIHNRIDFPLLNYSFRL